MRHRAFPGRGPEVEARYQRAAQWLLATIYRSDKASDWCSSNGVVLQKATGEGLASTGAYLVPTELSNAILDIRDSFGAFRRRARIVPMISDTATVPRHTGGAAVFMVGGGNTQIGETNVSPDAVNLTARKIGSLIRISSELEEDAATDIVDFLANEIAFAFAATEDDCAFNADGTSAYGHMRGIGPIVLDGQHNKAKVTAASGHNTYQLLDSTDLTTLMGSVAASAIPNAAWFASQTGYSQTICRLGITGGGYLETRMADGVPTPFFAGFPVILTQKLPLVTTTLSGKIMMAFGDMYGGGVLGQRRGVTIARSADRYLDQDQIGVLGTERFHAVVHDLGDNATFGSLAALIGG